MYFILDPKQLECHPPFLSTFPKYHNNSTSSPMCDDHCEAKPTTLKRPSPGDGVENHMYCLYQKNDLFAPKSVHIILNHFVY